MKYFIIDQRKIVFDTLQKTLISFKNCVSNLWMLRDPVSNPERTLNVTNKELSRFFYFQINNIATEI